ncbi:MAG: alpha/beta hydrolase-fold protein [Candidatus Sericytochromatia bacterium]
MESTIHNKRYQRKKLPYPSYLHVYSEIDDNLLSSPVKPEFKGKIERHMIKSVELDNERELDIYLPPSYSRNKDQRYPVLYMHDGNNLFYPEISFGGMPWKVDTTIENLVYKKLMEEIIVVGIHNTSKRSYEYTWTEMNWRGSVKEGGGGQKYANFIINDVKKLIDEKYRTKSDASNTAVMGSSLGGLISLYLGIKHHNTFSKIGIISPSLWWGYGQPLKDVEEITTDMKIWVDMGTKEGSYKSTNPLFKNYHLENTRTLRDRLKKKGYVEGVNLGYYEDDEGFHNEWSWGNRFAMPLLFFFGKL